MGDASVSDAESNKPSPGSEVPLEQVNSFYVPAMYISFVVSQDPNFDAFAGPASFR